MTPLNESFDKELQRMTQLAGIEQKPGSAKLLEAEKSGLNSKDKIVEKIQEMSIILLVKTLKRTKKII